MDTIQRVAFRVSQISEVSSVASQSVRQVEWRAMRRVVGMRDCMRMVGTRTWFVISQMVRPRRSSAAHKHSFTWSGFGSTSNTFPIDPHLKTRICARKRRLGEKSSSTTNSTHPNIRIAKLCHNLELQTFMQGKQVAASMQTSTVSQPHLQPLHQTLYYATSDAPLSHFAAITGFATISQIRRGLKGHGRPCIDSWRASERRSPCKVRKASMLLADAPSGK